MAEPTSSDDVIERLPVSFAAFVVSLATSAAVHFGDLPDPDTGDTRPLNLDGVSQVISLLQMLQSKTRGNLSLEERELLEGLIDELRTRLVQARNAGAPRIAL